MDKAAEVEAELRESGTKIDLEGSFALLNELSTEQEGVIESEIPILNGLIIKFKKIDRAIEFATGPINSVGRPPVIYQECNYGLSKTFSIRWKDRVLAVPDGAGRSIVYMGKGFTTSGLLYDLVGLSGPGEYYLRAMLPLREGMRRPLFYMLGEHFNVGPSLRAAGMIRLSVSGKDFLLYDYDKSKQRYLFFDSLAPLSLKEFYAILDSVLFCHAFISGSLPRDECMILQADSPRFDSIKGFLFQRQEGSIVSSEMIIDPKNHKTWRQLQKTVYLKEPIFNALIGFCLEEKELFRAVKLIVEARDIRAELAAATYCVALETVKNLIVTKNQQALQPIREDAVEGVRKVLTKALEEFPAEAFNDKKRLLKKIIGINNVGNMDGFLLAFEVMGIALTKEDKAYLRQRNDFLHGSISFKGENVDDPHQFELKRVYLHIQQLTCCLILKMAGYQGPVLNFWKYWELARGEDKDPTLLFKDI